MYGRSASRKPNSTECISKGGSQHTPVDAQHAFRRRAFMRFPNMTHSEGRARLILGTQTAQNASKGVLQHTPMLSMHSAGVLLPNRSSGIPPTCCIPNGVTPKQRSNAHNASAPSCRPHTASHHFQACMHWCAPICWSLRSSRGILQLPRHSQHTFSKHTHAHHANTAGLSHEIGPPSNATFHGAKVHCHDTPHAL